MRSAGFRLPRVGLVAHAEQADARRNAAHGEHGAEGEF
jgi:hypothetical protein